MQMEINVGLFSSRGEGGQTGSDSDLSETRTPNPLILAFDLCEVFLRYVISCNKTITSLNVWMMEGTLE